MLPNAFHNTLLILPLMLRVAPAALALGVSADTPDAGLPDAARLPRIRLAAIEGYDDDAAYRQSIADRAAELQKQTDAATDIAQEIDLLLAAANMILAYELEPPCSTKLLRIGGEPKAQVDEGVADAMSRAEGLLSRADALLADAPKVEGAAVERRLVAKQNLATLRAFAQALRAFLLDEDENATQTVRRAASGLAILLEDDSRHVAAAATLWHAILRSRSSDPARARSVLPLALSNPPKSSLPYAFLARLVRCRLLAADKGYAAALALLTQIEDRCDRWITVEPDRADAVRTTALVEIQILGDWYDDLDDGQDTSRRQWCRDRVTALTERYFAKDQVSVLRLAPAVPIVAQPPKHATTTPVGDP